MVKSSDLENYLVQNFQFIFFPIAYETKLTVTSENAKIIKCIGDDKNILDEIGQRKNEVNDNKIQFDFGTSFSSQIMILDKMYQMI